MRLGPGQVVLFDLDGTLADTAPDLVGALNAMRSARGLAALPFESVRPFASMGARGLVGKGFGVGPSDEDFAALRDEFLARYEAAMCVETRLFTGMAEVLAALDAAGLRWGVVSNKVERYVRPIMRELGVLERSVCVIGGDTTPTPKPHPAPLLLGARLAGVEPAACVYVGDDLRDVQAGRAAGMPTIAAAYGYCGDESPVPAWGADRTIASPLQLLDLLG